MNNESQNKSGNNQSAGFVGDGTTDNTSRIQAAIDSVSKAGGGVVEFNNGTFLTGPIEIRSNVTLEIKSNATLLATKDMKAYYPAGTDTSGPLPSSLLPLISSDHAMNIRISGAGTIDGNGQEWWTLYNDAKSSGSTLPARPRLIKLNNSTNITIDSLKLKNSPQFHVSLESCRHVRIEYVTITAPSNSPNTDGIDPATSHFVTISHCTIDNGDDNIAVKSGKPDPSDPNAGTTNIMISDCTFLHGHGVSIGSETSGGVDSMTVENCTFNGTTNGFRIKSYRGNGGDVRNIVYANNTMQNVEYPILFTGYYPKIPSENDPAQPVTSKTPYYHDITIDHLTSTNSPSAGLIIGLPEEPMKNIILKNINITANSGLSIRNAAVDTSNAVVNTPENGSGNITASAESVSGLTAAYEVPPAGTSLEVQKLNPDVSTSGSSATNSWPDDSSNNLNRYVEFSLAPKSGFNLTVDSLSMLIGNKGTTGMHAAVYYSVNPTFSNAQKVAGIDSLTQNNVTDTTFAGLNISVSDGQTLHFRVYPWLPGGTTSTSKYMYIGDVHVFGETKSPVAAATAIWPLSGGTKQQPAPFSGGFILQKGAALSSIY